MGMVLGKVSVETPKHEVMHRGRRYDIWRYPSQITATVHQGDVRQQRKAEDGRDMTDEEVRSMMFRTLARYIGVFSTPENRVGETETGEKIAMTAPVVLSTTTATTTTSSEEIAMTAPVIMTTSQEEGGDDKKMKRRETMTFLLPCRYDRISCAPTPTNPLVKVGKLAEGRCEAVQGFSGNLCMQRAEAVAETLLKELKEDGVKVIGEWFVCGYNAPFVLPWLKRNEVHVPVDHTPFVGVVGDVAEDC